MGSKKVGILVGIVGALIFAAILTYSMLGLRRHRVEVCVAFNGRTECRQAAGATRDEAIRTATDTACTMLASGMTDSIACGHTAPVSIKALQ